MPLRPCRSWRAASLRTQPSSSMAACTRSAVSALTLPGWFSTLDTVPTDTPARRATSFNPVSRPGSRTAVPLSSLAAAAALKRFYQIA